MATIFNSLLLLLAFYFITTTQLIALSSAGGFTLDFIHRDSPKSPFYSHSATKTDRFTNAVRRSFNRASRFKKQTLISPNDDIQSDIIPGSGEYLINISIGTPGVQVLAIADTGSDLTWTQCQPCHHCYDQTAPIFDPKNSSTYRAVTCQSRACKSLEGPASCDSLFNPSTCDKDLCPYTMRYDDNSYSNGDLAVETFTFGSSSGRPLSVPGTVFGCGFDNGGMYNETASGIVGLGRGPLSIVTQYCDAINGKFSYCLVAEENTMSKINFGENAVVLGEGVVSTSMVKDDDSSFYLTLESIKVGNKSVANNKTKMPSGTGSAYHIDIIIDTGTTLTLLPPDFYQAMENELVKAINKKTTPDPQKWLSLCYSDVDIDDVPTLTFQFTGVEWELPSSNTFVRTGDNLICLAIVPSSLPSIFGNLSQRNFLIGYDLENNQISFKPTDCGKQ